MNSKRRLEIIAPVLATATDNANARLDHERSQTGMRVQQSDHEYAQRILTATDKFESVEDMVFFEQSLQKSDFLKANSDEDRNSIIAAQKSYEKFTHTLGQMRKNPDGYFEMNMGNKEYNGDPHKIIKSNSMDYITGNITRMQNRKQFASESEKEGWDARIAMAKKTGDMFKTLHNNLADNFERKQKMQADREAKQQQHQERKGKGRE
jgi:hypothetical protein